MTVELQQEDIFLADRVLHHGMALKAYEKSFDQRNLTEAYKKHEFRRLLDVFSLVSIGDPLFPTICRNVDTFDLTNPKLASKVRDAIYRDIKTQPSAIACLKAVDRYCRFLKEEHTLYIEGQKPIYLPDIYGPIESPVNRYTFPRKSRDRVNQNYLTDNEYKQWLIYTHRRIDPNASPERFLKSFQLYLMCVIAGELGLRLQEILGLEPQYLNLVDNICHVTWGKGSKGSGYRKRTVPLSPMAKTFIQEFLKYFPRNAKEPLFQNASGKRLSKNTAHHWLSELIEDIKQSNLPVLIFKGFGWHAFRRSYATRSLQNGMHPYELKQHCGWAFLSTISYYIGDPKGENPNRGQPIYRRAKRHD